ncbi:hypothetical protein F4778DRAFT_418833 [Xylariomycetidae sp. FL2044]|nr:hypothetical protein F4778DRAFT_418833 [Xylariomycetidae sp. FL2044]
MNWGGQAAHDDLMVKERKIAIFDKRGGRGKGGCLALHTIPVSMANYHVVGCFFLFSRLSFLSGLDYYYGFCLLLYYLLYSPPLFFSLTSCSCYHCHGVVCVVFWEARSSYGVDSTLCEEQKRRRADGWLVGQSVKKTLK